MHVSGSGGSPPGIVSEIMTLDGPHQLASVDIHVETVNCLCQLIGVNIYVEVFRGHRKGGPIG